MRKRTIRAGGGAEAAKNGFSPLALDNIGIALDIRAHLI
jgi:hypothetical protein